MSEEEIINKLKERIKIDRSMRLNVESDFDRFCEEECIAIEELIDLYNKEKEKNEYALLEKEQLLEDSVSKDKIRKKIKEINNEKLNYSDDEYYLENEMKGYAIDKLKELLEEE